MRVLDDWLLSPARAAIHLPSATAVVADLHLGYEQARQLSGEAVPLAPLGTLLAPLRSLIPQARRLILAGDVFEAGADRLLAQELVDWTRSVGLELTAIVPGNHDRRISSVADLLPIHTDGFDLDGWRIVHGDGKRPEGRVVQGHEHPWVRWSPLLAGPCFLVGSQHLILPAFSTDAAGVNVLRRRLWGAHRCCVIAGEKVLDFGELRDLRKRMKKGS